MSGSGGGGGNGYDPEPSCDDIVVKTVLNSPVARVLAKLKPRDTLTVNVRPKGGKSVVAMWKNEIAGSITIAQIAALKKCIEKGHKYIAIVENIRSGRCEVLVTPANAK